MACGIAWKCLYQVGLPRCTNWNGSWGYKYYITFSTRVHSEVGKDKEMQFCKANFETQEAGEIKTLLGMSALKDYLPFWLASMLVAGTWNCDRINNSNWGIRWNFSLFTLEIFAVLFQGNRSNFFWHGQPGVVKVSALTTCGITKNRSGIWADHSESKALTPFSFFFFFWRSRPLLRLVSCRGTYVVGLDLSDRRP